MFKTQKTLRNTSDHGRRLEPRLTGNRNPVSVPSTRVRSRSFPPVQTQERETSVFGVEGDVWTVPGPLELGGSVWYRGLYRPLCLHTFVYKVLNYALHFGTVSTWDSGLFPEEGLQDFGPTYVMVVTWKRSTPPYTTMCKVF